MRYKPEEGEDILRLQIDEGIKLMMYDAIEYERVDDVDDIKPLYQSHEKLGNNLQELIAKKLKAGKEYVILLHFGDEDEEEQAYDECMFATLEVKIATS